ncbi:ABC transporter ATP-binding protein [Marinobacter qingdaonensis]|uniref:ABC transporter ATP-binding protein n=1 Tax=Marinobacter qingdaonensis TaxID=3108486 RepID=A0ABU5NVW4_9GAMM|nr:ABC transporter ATP-binding protein [Marinobacter sp. ASW11-75]MEA1079950.1 ABC transporter ATP-binding protein [Marinobacter sp. ASW11-75]
MGQVLLMLRGLTKGFDSGNERIPVLADLTLTLDRGQSLALMGRSGSGKSTLLNLLCGLEQPDAGVIDIAGERFDADQGGSPGHRGIGAETARRWADLRRQRIGVVFQDANLMPALSLLDNVRLRARLAGQDDGQCEPWLDRLGIGALANRYPDQVSGGQRQRAALAMVFAMKPALILADEPTGSLDRHTADEVAHELFALQADQGCALILATHDPELAARCGQRLDLAHTAAS